MQATVKAIRDVLEAEGVDSTVSAKVEEVLEMRLPPMTYKVAVWSLGIATVLLIGGTVFLAAMSLGPPESLSVALGASIGGLAGVLMPRE